MYTDNKSIYKTAQFHKLTDEQQLQEARKIAEHLNPDDPVAVALMVQWQRAEAVIKWAENTPERKRLDRVATVAKQAYMTHKRGKGYWAL